MTDKKLYLPNFEKRYNELIEWISEEMAHTLAKKLSNKQVENLLSEFREIVRRTRQEK